MSTLAAALATPPIDSRRRCGVNAWLTTLPQEDQDAARTAFKDTTWQTLALFDVFASQGFPGQVNIVSRHRLGRCPCL